MSDTHKADRIKETNDILSSDRPSWVMVAGQRCFVLNYATFSGVPHYGIMFTMLPQYHHDNVTESIGWVPVSLTTPSE